MNRRPRRGISAGWLAIPLLLFAEGSCTLLFDHNSAQCQTDDDCAAFGHHPYCTMDTHVCVPSGLQPKNCVFATPTNPPKTISDFLNQCSLNALEGDPSAAAGECLTFSRPLDSTVALKDPMTMPAPPPGAQPRPTIMCKDVAPPGGAVLYMTGSSNFPPLLEKLAPIITANTDLMVTPVFKTTSSCVGARAMLQTSTTYAADHMIKDPITSTDTYAQYVNNGKLAPCLLGAIGVPVDIGESEIYAETCGYSIKSADHVSEGPGPILPVVFVVPGASRQNVISSEAARQVFGAGGVFPWTDWTHFYVRGGGTATAQLVAREIGVPAAKLWGVDQGTAQALAANMLLVGGDQAETAIGILGSDFFEQNKLQLKALAFQASGQQCAYLPDSSSGSKDKINVRDGHYPIWGPMHFYYNVAGTTPPPAVAEFITLFSTPVIPTAMLDAFIDSGLVPRCSMMVGRDGEVGLAPAAIDPEVPLSSYRPSRPCFCHFDARVGKTPDTCMGCTLDSDCRPHQVCNYNFCEAEPN